MDLNCVNGKSHKMEILPCMRIYFIATLTVDVERLSILIFRLDTVLMCIVEKFKHIEMNV